MQRLEFYRAGVFLLLVLPLGCAAEAQNISIAPKLISFPNQATGASSLPLTVTINNNQTAVLNISNIQISSPFTQTNNCGSSLSAGQSCSLSITFSPTSVKYYSSSLTITDDAANSPQAILLTGSAVMPVVFSPTHVAFSNQAVASSSSSSQVTLVNNQSVALNISSIQTSAPYAQSNNCGLHLAAGQSCALGITFSPTAVKYYASSVTIADDAPGSPQTVALSGNGIVPVTFTPKVGGFYFTNQIVFTASTPQPLTITNNQSIPLTVSSITSSADYPFVSNCAAGGSLAAGATCTVEVSFDPQAVGSRINSITIMDSANGVPLTFPLEGTGIAGTPATSVIVTPPLPCILPSETEQFNASVTGIGNSEVFWYVDNILNGNSTVGIISASGFYTAPAYVGSHRIKAVSRTSSSVSGAATLSVTETPNFEIYPFVTSIPVSGSQTFQAQTCAVPDARAVSFSVDNIVDGNGSVGTVSSAGIYTAPALPGKHTVRVTDATLNRTSGGVVTVFSGITADFGFRTYTNHPVPPNIFGTGRGESIHSIGDRDILTQGGLTESRLYAQIPLVYATVTPNWSQIDPLISSIQAAGQHAILQLSLSPPWLEPTFGSCLGNTYAAPTDVNQWAKIAASYVAHMDSIFPDVVQDYEIWNEPNASGICSSDHLNSYIEIYAAAAPAMKAQSVQDGKVIRIGGPAL